VNAEPSIKDVKAELEADGIKTEDLLERFRGELSKLASQYPELKYLTEACRELKPYKRT